tara:strand:+ start:134 stop:472 length:339 start_codon:yes stop_codon:yes gene_type:complete
MELRYGQAVQLKKDIDLDFYCDGILPAGQMGYQETHYKIKFDQATIILPQSLVSQIFEEYKIEGNASNGNSDLSKLKKDELIELVKTAFPDKNYTGLKKDELIEILEGQTDA